MLIILGGLPAAGKTTIARKLGRQIGAIHLRIDSIEQALRNCGKSGSALDETGYQVGYAIAEDYLRDAHTVIADSVNPLRISRNGWLDVAKRAQVNSV